MYLHFLPLLLSFSLSCLAYQVTVLDTDYSRQSCSGMWANEDTAINVTFSADSQGQLAMLIYEWADVQFLGKITSYTDDQLPKTYVCTKMGKFIIDLPTGKYLNTTSFWTARVELPANQTAPAINLNPSPEGLYPYSGPIQYRVRKTGYYCVAMVPMTLEHDEEHATYQGLVLFMNTFNGRLPAADYPKVNFYFVMFLVYAVLGCAWGWLCYQHVNELLPIQYYLSGLVGLVIIEMVANWAYYRYLNAHGKSTASTVFLIVGELPDPHSNLTPANHNVLVAILDAGRNSMSFFMLLVVSLGKITVIFIFLDAIHIKSGLSVVRESLGRAMLKCQILAGGHFIFGILYAVGIVELDSNRHLLCGFLLWILYSLNATIAQLRARKQRYKLSMFVTLYRILLFTVVVIAIFFVVSTSHSLAVLLKVYYSAKSWRVRWWLLDGWLALLYLVAFTAISYLWRPSENNRRYPCLFYVLISTLAMSDEIAQDEEDADDYDLESMGQRQRIPDEDDDDAATLVGSRRGGHEAVADDNVVFEIGDEDGGSDDEEEMKKRRRRLSGEPVSGEDERRGLMNDGDRRED
ncbi:lung seven transmembrane receptor-domain-containing protein [Mycena rosella]|uniref:Lung seven transmembrane receptor-domain-containing protein n=1 Tax=Mycena rosella TaxID=1033263 RepID=A0AAD7M8W8_MYCRO|nr:lung seven transmembrane receptor-domain-containing protein [Mycena rosella]